MFFSCIFGYLQRKQTENKLAISSLVICEFEKSQQKFYHFNFSLQLVSYFYDVAITLLFYYCKIKCDIVDSYPLK